MNENEGSKLSVPMCFIRLTMHQIKFLRPVILKKRLSTYGGP